MFHCLLDQLITRTHIPVCPKDPVQDYHQTTRRKDAQIWIFQPFIISFAHIFQQQTKQDTDRATSHSDNTHLDPVFHRKCRDSCDMKILRMNPEASRKIISNQRCHHAWQQCRIVHHAHADNFHGKYRSCHRCTEYRRKRCTHSAHNDHMAVFLIQMDPPSQLIADTSAQLDRRTFPARRTTQQMRQCRSDKNQWC